jgi:hypothetical protein
MIRETDSNDRDGPIHHMARETGPCILALLSRTETLESCTTPDLETHHMCFDKKKKEVFLG